MLPSGPSDVARPIMPRNTKRTAARTHIDRMVKRIVKKFHPERVILFGSHARGDAGLDSDVDRLVVKDFEGREGDSLNFEEFRLSPAPAPFLPHRRSRGGFPFRSHIGA